MVYNSMYSIGTRPYIPRDNKKIVKKKEDEESSQFSHASESPQSSQTQQEESSIYKYPKQNNQQDIYDSRRAQDEARISYEQHIKNSTVNIAQILKDFKNTAIAIGTPDDLFEEVNSYMSLIEMQVKKDEPNVKLIKGNLKNASSLLDNYITETLQRPSKVVENWMDALFLQKIDYKFNAGKINTQFLVKFPDGKPLTDVEETEETKDTGNVAQEEATADEQKTQVQVPQDKELKSLFLQGKKYAYANDSKKALACFQQALSRSVAVNDTETQSKVLFEIGKIYDKNDYLSQALTSYNKSIKTTSDNNVKIQAHYSMGQIYEDVNQFDPAVNHYMCSISYAGEEDNLKAQSSSLTKIANMYSEKYDKKAFDFYTEAKFIATESKDSKTKGFVSSNTADAYGKFNQPQKALMFYSEAIQEYREGESPLKTAINYKKASDVMQSYGNSQKAKTLLQKALLSATKAGDAELVAQIKAQLEAMAK